MRKTTCMGEGSVCLMYRYGPAARHNVLLDDKSCLSDILTGMMECAPGFHELTSTSTSILPIDTDLDAKH